MSREFGEDQHHAGGDRHRQEGARDAPQGRPGGQAHENDEGAEIQRVAHQVRIEKEPDDELRRRQGRQDDQRDAKIRELHRRERHGKKDAQDRTQVRNIIQHPDQDRPERRKFDADEFQDGPSDQALYHTHHGLERKIRTNPGVDLRDDVLDLTDLPRITGNPGDLGRERALLDQQEGDIEKDDHQRGDDRRHRNHGRSDEPLRIDLRKDVLAKGGPGGSQFKTHPFGNALDGIQQRCGIGRRQRRDIADAAGHE